jgi:hypothetical protein
MSDTSYKQALEAVRQARSSYSDAGEAVWNAQATENEAERSLQQAADIYNDAYLKALSDHMAAQNLGWCTSGRHTAPLRALHGVRLVYHCPHDKDCSGPGPLQIGCMPCILGFSDHYSYRLEALEDPAVAWITAINQSHRPEGAIHLHEDLEAIANELGLLGVIDTRYGVSSYAKAIVDPEAVTSP